MSILIATPFSSLFSEQANRSDILGVSDALELRQPGQGGLCELPALFHCDWNLAAKWSEEEENGLSEIAKQERPVLISFHLASRYQTNFVVDGAFHGRGAAYSEDELLENVERNVRTVRQICGGHVPVLVENNNHLGTDAYDIVTDGFFISSLVQRNGLYLLWDVAHARITAFNKAIPVDEYLVMLPLERCLQVHLSRFGIRGGSAFDAHEELEESDWSFFFGRIHLAPKLRYVTVEYYRDKGKLILQLEKLRSFLRQMQGETRKENCRAGLPT